MISVPNLFGRVGVDQLSVFQGNPSDYAAGMAAHIRSDVSTPFLVGDVHCALLCDGEEGVVAGGELVTNGDFSSGLDNWAADLNGGSASARAGGGVELSKSSVSTANTVVSQSVTVPDGETWKLCVPLESVRGGGVLKIELDSVILQAYTSGIKKYYFDVVGNGQPKTVRIICGGSAVDGIGIDVGVVSLFRAAEDRSGRSNHAKIHGTLNRSRPAGSDIAVWSGFSDAATMSPQNVIRKTLNPAGAIVVTMMIKNGAPGYAAYDIPLHVFSDWDGTPEGGYKSYLKLQNNGSRAIRAIAYKTPSGALVQTGPACSELTPVTAVLTANRLALYANGHKAGDWEGAMDFPAEEVEVMIGTGLDGSGQANWNGDIGPVVIGNTVPSDDQIRDIHRDLLAKLKNPSMLTAPVSAIAHDPVRDERYVVGSDRKLHRLARRGTTIEQTIDVPADVSSVESLTVRDGEIVVGGDAGVWVSQPEQNLRALTVQKGTKVVPLEMGEGDGAIVDFYLPHGWKPERVYVDGRKKRKGPQDDWQPMFDGYRWFIRFAVAPGAFDIDCDAAEVKS